MSLHRHAQLSYRLLEACKRDNPAFCPSPPRPGLKVRYDCDHLRSDRPCERRQVTVMFSDPEARHGLPKPTRLRSTTLDGATMHSIQPCWSRRCSISITASSMAWDSSCLKAMYLKPQNDFRPKATTSSPKSRTRNRCSHCTRAFALHSLLTDAASGADHNRRLKHGGSRDRQESFARQARGCGHD
jgi:hypothetical protein